MRTLLTYEQQQELVKRKLATCSRNDVLGLDTFKYHRRVMYDYLWNEHPETLECRGHTYCIHTGEMVLAAPTKSFNYLENGYWADKPLSTPVTAYKKYNGFMATMSIFNSKIIVGSTGSTRSQYVELAKRNLFATYEEERIGNWFKGYTWLHEIVDESDPHIVAEEYGVKYLGVRENLTGRFIPAGASISTTIEGMLHLVARDKGEGFMMYDFEGNCCKIKTPYYVNKKILMRMPASKVRMMYNNPSHPDLRLNPTFVEVAKEIVKSVDKDNWIEYDDQTRRHVIERILFE